MSTPFTPVLAPYFDADPGIDVYWRVQAQRFWLGPPANLIELPSPHPDGYAAPMDSGEIVHGLMGGPAAVTRFVNSSRSWQLSWPRLAGRDYQIVAGFYRRLFGPDPWCFAPPEDVNRLTLAQSLCSGLNNAVEGWAASGGTLVAANTAAPYIRPSGVMQWTPASSASVLSTQLPALTPDLDRAAPYLPGMPASFTCWVRSTTGTPTVQARLTCRTDAGAVASAGATSAAVTVNATSWTLVSVSMPAGQCTLTGANMWCIPELLASGTTPLQISCAQMAYDQSTTLDWVAGAGVPRVALSSPIGRGLDHHMNTAAAMTLVETVVGAC